MRDEIYWVVTATVEPDRYDDVVAVLTPLVEATRQEAGSNAYDYSISVDRTLLHIHESYRDSAAVVTHVQDTFSRFADDFGKVITIDGFVVYGWPDEAAKEILDGFGSVYMTPFVGYTATNAN